MKKVHIVEGFVLTLPNGSQRKFTEGYYDLEDDVAGHWYVVAHSDDQGPYQPRIGTPEYAKEQVRKLARRKLIDAAVEEAAEEKR